MNSGNNELSGHLAPRWPMFPTPSTLRAACSKGVGGVIEFILLTAVFLIAAYFSVSPAPPNAIPVHHDDYSNYASGAGGITVGWVRPLSSVAIQLLAAISPDYLIWCVRLLTVLYVFLHWKLFLEFCSGIRLRTLSSVLFGAAVLSTPVAVEYGRYTGMITHLISGCLGVAATLLLLKQLRSPNRAGLYLSVCLFILSTLAKEDFVLLYVVSLLYVVWFQRSDRIRIALVGAVGLGAGALVVLGAKILAKSAFLGIPDPGSTYFVDLSPNSITTTVIKYLKGALHPAMAEHGAFYFALFLFSVISFAIATLVKRRIPNQVFFLVAGLAVIAPYSLLPNHVNAYYEILWLPLVLSAAISACISLFELLYKSPSVSRVMVVPLLFAVALAANAIDYQGRKSVASWYDSVSSSNSRVLALLEERKESINQVGEVCIVGADMFSPWYMHDGSYLVNVLGLRAHWIMLVGDNAALAVGISMAKERSSVRVSVYPSAADFPSGCLLIDVAKNIKAGGSTGS